MAKVDFGGAALRARRTLDGFTRGQKAMLVIAGLAVAFGALMLSRWSSQQSYATLFSNLAPADAAAVTQDLDATGVKYKLAAGGSSILVPQEAVYRTRIDLSAKGLPTDGAPGYSLLDKQGLTTSEFRQHVDYQRALEGELSKTIRAIDGVAGTSVHLVIPQEDLFSGDTQKPSASVLVKTVGTNRLSSNQVQAIVHLVASSVEGLAPEDVTLADANGNVLAAPGQDSSAASSTRNEQTKAYEDTLAASLQDMVQKVTGDGHTVVKVKAELDFDKKSTTTETYADAAKATPIAQKSTKETFTGNGGSAATGVLGANGAAAAAASTTTNGATATGATSSYTKEDSQSDFAVGKVVETVSATPGTVTRLSVAVLLDGRRKVNAASLRKLVSAAAGLQTARGDKLEVGQLPFDQTGQKEAATQLALASQTEQKKAMFDMVKSGLLALLALMSVFFAWRGAKKSAGTRTVDPIPLDSLPRPRQLALLAGEDDEDDDEDDRPRRSRRGGSNDDDDEDGPLALPADVEPRPDIAALIEKQPADVANMLREWLGDRRN